MRTTTEGRGSQPVESGLLFVVLELHPEHLSLAELAQRMSGGSVKSKDEEASDIYDAAASLMAAGLLVENDGKVAPTPAALRFNALYI